MKIALRKSGNGKNSRKKKGNKSQVGMEFLVLFGFMMLVFVIFFVLVQNRIINANREQKAYAIQDVAKTVINEISLAKSAEDGYYREFLIPQDIDGISYIISFDESSQELELVSGDVVHLEFLDKDIFGTIGLGKNSISKNAGIITIINYFG